MKKAIILALIIVVPALPGYAGGMPDDMPGATTISFEDGSDYGTPAEEIGTIQIFVGQEAVIKLKADIDGGYKWEIAGPWDENVLEFMNDTKERPERKGDLAVQAWIFKGLRSGNVELAFRYSDQEGDTVKGARNAVFSVIVKDGPKGAMLKFVGKQAPYNIIGTVGSVKFSGPIARVNPVITLLKENGQIEEFVVKPLVYVQHKDGDMARFSEIVPGARVLINYRIGHEDVREAVVIQIL
ncbi:MAG: protease inhibitor I42 family protein [Candidatus Omnitrophica bacterium]|nr:protease inhibitor I42 family protein [Candidatus Omnitrophota bacterium]